MDGTMQLYCRFCFDTPSSQSNDEKLERLLTKIIKQNNCELESISFNMGSFVEFSITDTDMFNLLLSIMERELNEAVASIEISGCQTCQGTGLEVSAHLTNDPDQKERVCESCLGKGSVTI